MKNVKKLGRERSNFFDLMLIDSTNITRPFIQKLKFYKKKNNNNIAGSLVNSLLIVAPKTAPILLSHFFA